MKDNIWVQVSENNIYILTVKKKDKAVQNM